MTLAFTYSDSVQLSSKMHPWDQIHSLFHGKSMSYISFGNTQIGSFCVMSKFALKIALTACNIICDLLFPSWQMGITISDFCKIIGIASIWDNTKTEYLFQEVVKGSIHPIPQNAPYTLVEELRKNQKRPTMYQVRNKYIKLLGSPPMTCSSEISRKRHRSWWELNWFRFNET